MTDWNMDFPVQTEQKAQSRNIPKDGILPQYRHLKGMAENMAVIRKLLGLSEYGRLPNTGIGRTLQKFIDNNS